MLSVGDIAKKWQPSLFWCTRNLPKSEREALYTLFAFCRHLSNIAHADMSIKQKKEIINAWREELNNIYDKKIPASNIGRKIYKNCMRFNLPKQSWLNILEGASINIIKPIQSPTKKDFDFYIQGIAIEPLLLALMIIGEHHTSANQELAYNLGHAVMETFFLRDIKDNAKKGYMYIPAEILQKYDIKTEDPSDMIENKNIYLAREFIANEVDNNFHKASRILNKMSKKNTLFFCLLKNFSEAIFYSMKKRGWEIISPKPQLNLFARCIILYKTIFK